MKFIFVTMLLISFLNAAYEKIKIGEISPYHKNKITPEQLKSIIDEIEYTFEKQLGFNVFDYSSDGKPIDLIYISPSIAEKRVERKIEKYNKKIEKSNSMVQNFDKSKIRLENLQKEYNSQSEKLNKIIISFNEYVKKVNKKREYPQNEYEKIKHYILKQKEYINIEKNKKQRLENKLRLENSKYNNKINSYNNLVSQINTLSFEIESLIRNMKVVRGQAIGQKIITFKTYLKDGSYVREKSVKNTMNKIEIYIFESFEQLKVILAHEIAHLVGIPHINAKNALMNPILQENQIKKLEMTNEDIVAFRKFFN